MVWGGQRLAELYGKPLPPGVRVGESFEVSGYPGRQSVVAEGPLAGSGLADLTETWGAALIGDEPWARSGHQFPLLVKLLDAQDDLSVQVHPDDLYAQSRGWRDRGKTEAWYVLHSDQGRVACGLLPGVDRAAFAAAAAAGRISDVVRFHSVQAGDVVFLPAGVVHALCAGVVIYEVQQPSDLTFRVYDYDRPGLDGQPRELHLDQAMAVMDFDGQAPVPTPAGEVGGCGPSLVELVRCSYFTLSLAWAEVTGQHHPETRGCRSVTVVEGTALMASGDQSCRVAAGSTVLVPASRPFHVRAVTTGGCRYLVAAAA
jgi:mannose-6-phosphate isomerase